MKTCRVVLCMVATSVATVAAVQAGGHQEEYEPSPYHYQYQVHHDKEYLDFGAEEEGDGHGDVHGHYHVQLPDGRLQKVSYKVDDYSGYIAEVSYDGQAVHPTYHGHGGHGGGHSGGGHRFGKAEQSFSDHDDGNKFDFENQQIADDRSFTSDLANIDNEVTHAFSRQGKSGRQENNGQISNFFGESSHSKPVVHSETVKSESIAKPSEVVGFKSKFGEPKTNDFFQSIANFEKKSFKPVTSFGTAGSSGTFSHRFGEPSSKTAVSGNFGTFSSASSQLKANERKKITNTFKNEDTIDPFKSSTISHTPSHFRDNLVKPFNSGNTKPFQSSSPQNQETFARPVLSTGFPDSPRKISVNPATNSFSKSSGSFSSRLGQQSFPARQSVGSGTIKGKQPVDVNSVKSGRNISSNLKISKKASSLSPDNTPTGESFTARHPVSPQPILNKISQYKPAQSTPRFKGHPIGFTDNHPVFNAFSRHRPTSQQDTSSFKGSVGHQGSFGDQVSRHSSGRSLDIDTDKHEATVADSVEHEDTRGHRSFITHKALPV